MIAGIIPFSYLDYFTYPAWGKICLARGVRIIEGVRNSEMKPFCFYQADSTRCSEDSRGP